ncbi:MAG: Fur family transcriptional regulator [Actinomycetota bacterium]
MNGEREQALQRSGLRVTKQRLAVLKALEGRTEALTAQDLHHELRASGTRAGLATVYRTLASLAQAGVLDTFWRDGEQAFRLCGDKHHHHLVCNDCGAVEEVSSEAIESWVARVAKKRGFTVTGHSAEVYGICSDCG